MRRPLLYNFAVTSVFSYIRKQCEEVGLYVHYEESKETLQLFLNQYSYSSGEKYIGAIQYEGSNDYQVREPHIVSFRFKRINLPIELRGNLESLSSFRRDKNSGSAMNPKDESIAFKFEELNEESKEAISLIISTINKYLNNR